MSSEGQKKVAGKRKLNGKKGSKSNAAEKTKYEMENCAREQITELEKEIFSIKISEMEGKLARKKQMCFVIEKERNLYEDLYEEKKILKRENMKLLNNIYEEFFTEFFLLQHELHAMELTYSEILKGKEFCIDRKERVKRLTSLELLLERKLSEAEKSTEEIVALRSCLADLENKTSAQLNAFRSKSTDLILQYKSFSNRILDELIITITKIIKDRCLKLELLPLFYQALFLSGTVGTFWLKSTLEHCEHYLVQNLNVEEKNFVDEEELRKKLEKTIMRYLFEISTSLQVKDFMNLWNQNLMLPDMLSKSMWVSSLKEQESHIERKRKMALYQDEIKVLRKNIERLERTIKMKELTDEKLAQNSQLAQKVNVAVEIITREI